MTYFKIKMFTKSQLVIFLRIFLGFTAIFGIYSLFVRNIHNIKVEDIYKTLDSITTHKGYSINTEIVSEDTTFLVSDQTTEWTPARIPGCSVQKRVTYRNCRSNSVEDIMAMNLPAFLPEYKNPCYLVNLTTAEVYNPISYYRSEYRKHPREPYFRELESIWRKRLMKEKNPQRVRCLPYLYIAGVQKSGTTDLWAQIEQHPQFLPGTSKENHYWARKRFGTTSGFRRRKYVGKYDKLWQYIDMYDKPGEYLRTHKDLQGKAIIADGSVATAHENDQWRCSLENLCLEEPAMLTPHYIHHLTPQARVMMILRNPTDRLYSDAIFFSHIRSPGLFHKRALATVKLFRSCLKQSSARKCLYDFNLQLKSQVDLRASLYAIFIADWLSVFPKENFYFIKFEEYSANRSEEMSKIYEFLDLDPFINPTTTTIWRYRKKRTPMWHRTRVMLDRFFAPYNAKLSEMLNDRKWLWEGLNVAITESTGGSTTDAMPTVAAEHIT